MRIFFLFFIQKYLFNTFLTVILYFSYLFIFFICTSTYKKFFFLNAISFYQQMQLTQHLLKAQLFYHIYSDHYDP